MKAVDIYTDGACSGNPGPGGWAAILFYKGHMRELCGGEAYTTNQRMELRAVIEGLQALTEPCSVTLYSDSAYVVNAFHRRWLETWQQNGWQNSRGEPVKNSDLWQALLPLVKRHTVRFVKVKGHSDNRWNEHADQLASASIPRPPGGGR